MISKAFGLTVKSLMSPSILFILLLPFLIASTIWTIVLFTTWGIWTEMLIQTSAYQWAIGAMGENLFLESLRFLLVFLGTLLVFGPLWYLTYILLISVLLFPLLMPRVKAKFYPQLPHVKGGSFSGSLKNTIVATVVFLFGFLISLPLWAFTPLSPAISVFLTAYLNKKIFTYDVFQDFASQDERNIIALKWNHELWVLGFITALLSYVPFVNFLAPPITALAFIHYLLGRLQEERKILSTGSSSSDN